jgi:hypothetical protein
MISESPGLLKAHARSIRVLTWGRNGTSDRRLHQLADSESASLKYLRLGFLNLNFEPDSELADACCIHLKFQVWCHGPGHTASNSKQVTVSGRSRRFITRPKSRSTGMRATHWQLMLLIVPPK